MTDSYGNQGEVEKLRLFSKFLRESFFEQSENSQEPFVEMVRVGDVVYTLFSHQKNEGPSLLVEVEDVDGFRYFVTRWRTPLDSLAEESLSTDPLAGMCSPEGQAWSEGITTSEIKSCESQAGF